MTMQGKGKIRLIAKKGRFRETEFVKGQRELIQNSTLGARSGDPELAAASPVARDRANNKLLYGEGTENYYIEFDATPDITESGSVAYFEAGEIRGPGSILMYMGSPSRTFSINAKLIARNQNEALRVSKQIHILKSWRMPESYTGGFAAGTPTILYLQGYGKMFKDIPVVMTDLSIELSSEHDYISTGGQETLSYIEQVASVELDELGNRKERDRNKDRFVPRQTIYDSFVPIITTVSISLKEARSVEADFDGLETFDILKYRTGNLVSW